MSFPFRGYHGCAAFISFVSWSSSGRSIILAAQWQGMDSGKIRHPYFDRYFITGGPPCWLASRYWDRS
jgi:hypothetical protein